MRTCARKARSVGALSFATATVLVLAACRDDLPEPPAFAPDLAVDLSNSDRTDAGLYIEVLDEGEGDPSGGSEKVAIYYVGWLPDGEVFDSNEGEAALIVDLSEDFLIDGVMEGLQGIRLGERRALGDPTGSRLRGDGRPGLRTPEFVGRVRGPPRRPCGAAPLIHLLPPASPDACA